MMMGDVDETKRKRSRVDEMPAQKAKIVKVVFIDGRLLERPEKYLKKSIMKYLYFSTQLFISDLFVSKFYM